MLKKIIKRVFHFFFKKDSKIYYILYYNYYSAPYLSIENVINSFSINKKQVIFLQIGSNDGVSNDPISKYIKRDKWKGVLVEPVKYAFDILVSNYQQEGLIFENVAISDKKELKEFYYVKDLPKNIPHWVSQVSSFNKEITYWLKTEFPDIDISCEKVQCDTVGNVLAKNKIANVDIIHIDTEGYDWEIIKGIDFIKIKPQIILFEHRHLKHNEYSDCLTLLKNENYYIHKEKFDTIAFTGKFLPKAFLKNAL